MAKNNQNNPQKELLTINEVAEIFGVHPETLRRWNNEGKLKAIRIGKFGHRKYRREDIRKMVHPCKS